MDYNWYQNRSGRCKSCQTYSNQTFIASVQTKALGQEVLGSLSPGQSLIKVVNDELVQIMGEQSESLNLSAQPPAVVLMAGLQGSGKTTSTGKLALWLKEKEKRKVMVVSCDVYRPAAIKQLQKVAGDVGAEFFPSEPDQAPVDIANAALAEAKKQYVDVLIVDTAGRLAVDEAMMAEIKELNATLSPIETLFVVDSMTGQDAATTAQAFGEALPLTGVILTKTDGDAILGMGDVVSLVEEVHEKVDHDKADRLARKMQKGKSFDMIDLRDQMEQMQKMGGMASLMDKLPGAANLPDAVKNQADDTQVRRTIAIINSMTPQERKFPAVIKGSRKKRIAAGSGVQIQDVNRLLKQHLQMAKMMKKMAKGGMKKMLRGMKGQMPPGMGM